MEKETARIEAFSDGVFAIAITLLILEIKVPGPAGGDLALQLLKQWPSYLAFVLSFFFIGIMWINHHRLFNHIKRADNGPELRPQWPARRDVSLQRYLLPDRDLLQCIVAILHLEEPSS